MPSRSSRRYAPSWRFFSTLSSGKRRRPSGQWQTPSATTRWAGRGVRSATRRRIVPRLGTAREIALRSVDLPAPFGPSTPRSSPGSTVRPTSPSARALPSWTTRSATSSSGIAVLRPADIGLDDLRMAHDLGRRPDRDDLAEVDRDHPRDELHELAQLVLDDQDGEPGLGVQATDQRRERLDLAGAEPGEGLVRAMSFGFVATARAISRRRRSP